MLDTNGYVCEATGETLHRPQRRDQDPPLTAILDGITASIIKIARDLGYTVKNSCHPR